MQVKSLDHIHIYAAEPEESARFYTHHFEAKPITRFDRQTIPLLFTGVRKPIR